MRSLHVVSSTARRGAETFAIDLASELRKHGEVADVVALTEAAKAGYDIAVLGPRRRSPSTLLSLRRRARAYDVVVAHGSSTLEACSVALLGLGVPFLYRVIGDPTYWATTTLKRQWVRLLLARSATAVVLWPDARDSLATQFHVPHARIDVIANGVSTERFPPASAEERLAAREEFGLTSYAHVLAFVGALSEEKNVEAAIAAVAAVDSAVLLVAGSGSHEASLREFAERTASGRVRFLGSRSDVRPVYAAADLLLLPSWSEGVPAVVIEAGLVGTPTVASHVGGVASIIATTGGGVLAVDPSRSEFVRRVVQSVSDGLQPTMEVGERYRACFSIDAVGRQWSATMNTIVTRRRLE